jgi:hypothetical protein
MLNRSRFLPLPWVLAGLGWLALIGAGFGWIHAYETTAGPESSLHAAWSSRSAPEIAAGHREIVMAVHPRCPCTEASLRALARIMEKSNGQTDVRLLVYRPEHSPQSWAGSHWKDVLKSTKGIAFVDDPGGREASRLGMKTSGAVVFFDGSGQLRFVGGLTATRGADDDSIGVELLRTVVAGGVAKSTTCDVFGCPLATVTVGNQRRKVTGNE